MSQHAPDYLRVIAERNIEAILDAADRLLGRGSQLSIAAVAAEAGLSRVTVYSHFLNLEALLEAVVERAVRRTMALFDQADLENGPPLEAVERLINIGWEELDHHRARAHAGLQQLRSEALARSHEAVTARMRDVVERGRNGGGFRTDLPADWLVKSWLALVHAAAEEVHAGRTDATSARALLTATIRELFLGPGAVNQA
jgi:TetR/AcrR family transcriptional regulator, mexCD-oprJ operon repressor